jgi:hypothetical protein
VSANPETKGLKFFDPSLGVRWPACQIDPRLSPGRTWDGFRMNPDFASMVADDATTNAIDQLFSNNEATLACYPKGSRPVTVSFAQRFESPLLVGDRLVEQRLLGRSRWSRRRVQGGHHQSWLRGDGDVSKCGQASLCSRSFRGARYRFQAKHHHPWTRTTDDSSDLHRYVSRSNSLHGAEPFGNALRRSFDRERYQGWDIRSRSDSRLLELSASDCGGDGKSALCSFGNRGQLDQSRGTRRSRPCANFDLLGAKAFADSSCRVVGNACESSRQSQRSTEH